MVGARSLSGSVATPLVVTPQPEMGRFGRRRGGARYAPVPLSSSSAPSSPRDTASSSSSSSQASLLSTFLLSWRYVRADARRDPRALLVAIATVALTVAFVCVLRNAVAQSPLVFLKLAENQLGEMDLVLLPSEAPAGGPRLEGRAAAAALINATLVSAVLDAAAPLSAGVAPRWVLPATLHNPDGNALVNASEGQDFSSAPVVVLVVDSEAERRAGIGRAWDLPDLGPDECYVSHGALREVGVLPERAAGRGLEAVAGLVGVLDAVQSGGATGVDDVGGEGAGGDAAGDGDQDDDDGGTAGTGAGPAEASALVRRLAERYVPEAAAQWEEPLLDANATALLLGSNLTAVLEAALPPGSPLLRLAEDVARNATLPPVTLGQLVDAAAGPALAGAEARQPCLVRGVVESPEGKWPASLGSVVMYDKSTIRGVARRLADAGVAALLNATRAADALLLSPASAALSAPARAALERLSAESGDAAGRVRATAAEAGERPGEHALTAVVMNRDRVEAYSSDAAGLGRAMARFTNQVALALGLWHPARFTAPLASVVQRGMVLRYLLDNVFYTISAVVVALGALLIYSLLLEDVAAKAYEFGMLRALGLRARSLVAVIVVRTAWAAVPGVCAGLLLAWLASVPVALRVASFTALPPRLGLERDAVLLAVAVGTAMPLVANLVPVSRALSAVLRDSLDVFHQSGAGPSVAVRRLESLGISAWQTALALLTVGAGFVTYVLIPYAFVYREFALFLMLLTLILLGMLAGLCVLAGIVQPPLERAWLRVLAAAAAAAAGAPPRALRSVVAKNLSGHRHRNRKTAAMFTLCQAFVVFASVMFLLQGRGITDNTRVILGADLVVRAPNHRPDLALDEPALRAHMERERARPGSPVVDFTFVSARLRGTYPGVGRVRFGSLPGIPRTHVHAYAVERNFLRATYSALYRPGGAARDGGVLLDDGRPDLVADMYEAEEARRGGGGGVRVPGSVASGGRPGRSLEHAYTQTVDAVASTALAAAAGLSADTPLRFSVGRLTWMGAASGFCTKVPGFARFTSHKLAARNSPVLLTVGAFSRAVNESTRGEHGGVTYQRLLVRFREGTPLRAREDVADGIRPLLASDKVRVIDTQLLIDTTGAALELLTLFFSVAGAVALLMSSFILWQSVTSSVREHGWEFGVLRSLGLTGPQVVLVHVLEALSLVLAALLLGTAVGACVAVALTLQQHMFDELPFVFLFPWASFFGMLALAVCLSVAASAIPARALLRKPIARVLRRMD